MLRQCLANDDVPISRDILRLENIGEQGDRMAFCAVMGPFNQAKSAFLGPTRNMVFDFGGYIDIGAPGMGDGSEIRTAAAAESNGGNCRRQRADDVQRRQLEGITEPAEETGGGDGLRETADSSQPLMRVVGGGAGNEWLYFIQADGPGQRVADAVGGAVEVGVAGDDTDAVREGQFDEPTRRFGGVDRGQGFEDQRVMRDDGVGADGYRLFAQSRGRVETDQDRGGLTLHVAEQKARIVPWFGQRQRRMFMKA